MLPAEWFATPVTHMQDCCAVQPGWFNILCTILMILLLLNALSPQKLFGGHHHCHCHDCEEENSQCESPTINYKLSTINSQLPVGDFYLLQIRPIVDSKQVLDEDLQQIAVEGVKSVTVSLEEGTAHITGNFLDDDIRKAVESIGFALDKQG